MNIRKEVVDSVARAVVSLINTKKLSVAEMLQLISDTCYAIGASLEGYKERGPQLEELRKLYYQDSTRVGVALMLQGLMVGTWIQGLEVVEEEVHEKEEGPTICKGTEEEPQI